MFSLYINNMALININNRYIKDVKWLNTRQFNFTITPNNVDIYRIDITSNLAGLDDFAALLKPDETERANRYFYEKDKNRSIISRGALRYILGKYLRESPCSIEFGVGINKKPYIKNNTNNICYNISHSGDWILIAIANSEIGTDIELINPDFNYKEVLADNFSINEINHINQNNPLETFYMLWTRKEALTKASGKGLDEDLKLIPCLDGDQLTDSKIISLNHDTSVSSFTPCNQYIGSVATGKTVNEFRFWSIDFY